MTATQSNDALAVDLARRRAAIDAALDTRLPPATTRPRILHEAIRYALLPGGKRLRPILCLAAAEAAQPTPGPACAAAAMAAALAVELLHTYTLIHDDLPCMDDDNERRGRPTVHVRFGEANAVLAGDALQAMAFEWAAGAGPHAAGIVTELALAAGSQGVVGGQVEDVAAAGHVPTPDTLDFVHRHKTADLFRAALRMGAIAGEADPATRDALGRYGEALGRAFQITDDLLDAEPADGGRPELSCLALMDRGAARSQAERHLHDAVTALASVDGLRRFPLDAIARTVAERAV